MNDFKTIDSEKVSGKRVLVRVDLNVPMKNGKVTDATRIERAANVIVIGDGNYLQPRIGSLLEHSPHRRCGVVAINSVNVNISKAHKKIKPSIILHSFSGISIGSLKIVT